MTLAGGARPTMIPYARYERLPAKERNKYRVPGFRTNETNYQSDKSIALLGDL